MEEDSELTVSPPDETISFDHNEVIASLSAQLAAKIADVAKLQSALSGLVRARGSGTT